jgi:hypothetical protein
MMGPPGACNWQNSLTTGNIVNVGEVLGKLNPS